jgi:hypothetical protein
MAGLSRLWWHQVRIMIVFHFFLCRLTMPVASICCTHDSLSVGQSVYLGFRVFGLGFWVLGLGPMCASSCVYACVCVLCAFVRVFLSFCLRVRAHVNEKVSERKTQSCVQSRAPPFPIDFGFFCVDTLHAGAGIGTTRPLPDAIQYSKTSHSLQILDFGETEMRSLKRTWTSHR